MKHIKIVVSSNCGFEINYMITLVAGDNIHQVLALKILNVCLQRLIKSFFKACNELSNTGAIVSTVLSLIKNFYFCLLS